MPNLSSLTAEFPLHGLQLDSSLSVLSFAKNSCTYAHHIAPMLNGDRVVVAHSPRTDIEEFVVLEIAFLSLEEGVPCPFKLTCNLLFVSNVAGHAHHASDTYSSHRLPFPCFQIFETFLWSEASSCATCSCKRQSTRTPALMACLLISVSRRDESTE